LEDFYGVELVIVIDLTIHFRGLHAMCVLRLLESCLLKGIIAVVFIAVDEVNPVPESKRI
jgi:hypothetical protein